MNRFFKIRAVIAIICIIISLCVVSIGIAIKISLTILEKRDNIVSVKTDKTDTAANDTKATVKMFNFNKAKKLTFYYNGLHEEEFLCYAGENGEILFPFDLLLKKLDTGYSVLNADDIMKTVIAGKALNIKLNSNEASWGEKSISLNAVSAAFNGHIFVSSEILSCFDNYSQDVVVLDDAVYLNFWPSTLSKEYDGFRLLKMSGSTVESYSIFGNGTSAKTLSEIPGIEEIYPVTGTAEYLIKAGSRYHILDESFETQLIAADNNAMLSTKHGQIYWIDSVTNRLYVYNIIDKKTVRYRNYFTRIAKSDSSLLVYNKLYNYDHGSKFARFDFLGRSEDDIYTVIERDGKVVLEGKSFYSPDSSKLVCLVKNKGFYTANADGTDIAFAGAGMYVRWVDNNRIIIDMGNSSSVYDVIRKSIAPVDVTRVLAGTTANGNTFSIRAGILYVGPGLEARQLFQLPWSCDYIYAPSENGPYVILSAQEKKVFCLTDKFSYIMADTEKFINRSSSNSASDLFRANSAVGPGNDKLAILQNENGLLQVNLVDMETFKLQKIVVDSRYGEQPEGNFEILWLDKDKLILHSDNLGWVLDLSNGIHIYSWEESESGTLKGFTGK